MESKKVVMTFVDNVNAKYNVTVKDVKDDLSKAEIKACMDYALTNKCFTTKHGDIMAAESAAIVTTTETEYKM